MEALRAIGLIGGLSWHSTLEYYRQINSRIEEQLGKYRSAPILLSSVDFGPIVEYQLKADWSSPGRILAEEAKKLEAAGAEALLICSNTMHKVAPQVQEKVHIPLIHIATAIARELKAQSKSQAILLGTRYTMNQSFLYDALRTEGIEAQAPTPAFAKAINKAIFKRLVRGEVTNSDRQLLSEIVDSYGGDPTVGIVLGCTELGLLVSDPLSNSKLVDSAKAHANLATEFVRTRYLP